MLQLQRAEDLLAEAQRRGGARVVSLEATVQELHLEDDGKTADVWVDSGGSHI